MRNEWEMMRSTLFNTLSLDFRYSPSVHLAMLVCRSGLNHGISRYLSTLGGGGLHSTPTLPLPNLPVYMDSRIVVFLSELKEYKYHSVNLQCKKCMFHLGFVMQ